MRQEYLDMLHGCVVRNGELILDKGLSQEDLIGLGDELRNDLLAGRIPHCKVIGAHINPGTGVAIPDFISKRSDINRSYAELYTVFDELIFEAIDGKPFNGFNSDGAEDWGYVSTCAKEVTSVSGMHYVGKGIDAQPRCLLSDVDIIRFGSTAASLNMVISEGTGDKNFNEISSTLKGTDFIPFGQYYNLSQYITIRRYMDGDKTIKFMYKRKINEEVLTSILRHFATVG